MSHPKSEPRPCVLVPIPRTMLRTMRRLGAWLDVAGSVLLALTEPRPATEPDQRDGPMTLGGYL